MLPECQEKTGNRATASKIAIFNTIFIFKYSFHDYDVQTSTVSFFCKLYFHFPYFPILSLFSKRFLLSLVGTWLVVITELICIFMKIIKNSVNFVLEKVFNFFFGNFVDNLWKLCNKLKIKLEHMSLWQYGPISAFISIMYLVFMLKFTDFNEI